MQDTKAAAADELDVEQLVAPLRAKASKTSRVTMLGFLGMGLFCGLLMAYLGVTTPPIDATEVISLSSLSFFFMGVLPALALRHLVRRDLRAAPGLVRHGERHPGRILANLQNPGMQRIRVGWEENGRQFTALFDIETIHERVSPEITVIARRRSKIVGVILNDRLYLGIRSLRDRIDRRGRRARAPQ